MKRFISILFLALILLNTIGYYGILQLAREQITWETLRKIDENVNALSGNMILKIPLSLPYNNDSLQYERIDGEIVSEGVIYRKVKQMLYHDTLYIVCIRDLKTTEVSQAISACSQNFSDEATESEAGVKLMSAFVKEYIIVAVLKNSITMGWQRSFQFKNKINLYSHTLNSSIFRPPISGPSSLLA